MSAQQSPIKQICNQLLKWLRREPTSRQDFNSLLSEAKDNHLIDEYAHKMIEGVLKVTDQHARDIMIPRAQMITINASNSCDEAVPTVIDSGHSRFPVISDSKDHVMGILLAKDLLRASQNNNTDITPLLRPATFIPESKRLDILLREFRSKASHIAIVVDEYGGVAGLVTIEDVLEQIVGDIEDEYDNLHDSQHIKKISYDEYTVHAQTPIEFFNAYFDTVYSDDAFDTIGGLVLKRFAHLPKIGESLTFDNFQVTVLSASKRRIHLLRFKKNASA